jgi:hypothetical protein
MDTKKTPHVLEKDSPPEQGILENHHALLGKGAFGTIHAAMKSSTQIPLAVKILPHGDGHGGIESTTKREYGILYVSCLFLAH